MQIKKITLQNYSEHTSENIFIPGFRLNVYSIFLYVGFASNDEGNTS